MECCCLSTWTPSEVPVCNGTGNNHLRADMVRRGINGGEGDEKQYKMVEFAAGAPLQPGAGMSFVSYQGDGRIEVVGSSLSANVETITEVFGKRLKDAMMYRIVTNASEYTAAVRQNR